MFPPDELDAMNISIEITDLKIRYMDGTEVPATVTLRDKDLDLVFISPTTAPAQPQVCIDLGKVGKPALGDQIIFLYRLPQIGGRVIGVSIDRICAIIEKPRTFYVPDAMNTDIGSPAFTPDGAFVGIAAPRTGPVPTGGGDPDTLGVIVTATDVIDGVTQATAPKAP
jgi:hypothetical protein